MVELRKPSLRLLWERVRESYWFVPGLMTAVAVLLLLASVALSEWLEGPGLVTELGFAIRDKESAAQLLTTVIGSTINVISIVFSLTLVSLTIVASQYGSQVLSSFMADTATKFSLGTFIATFVYCLLTLRFLASLGADEPVPQLAMSLALLLVLLSAGVLVFFIHHIARSIQVADIIGRLYSELVGSMHRLYPQAGPEPSASAEAADNPRFAGGPLVLTAAHGGYLQDFAHAEMVRLCRRYCCRADLQVYPGAFVVPGAPLAELWLEAPHGELDPEQLRCLRGTFVLGSQRTAAEDLQYSLEKLVELAVRALSPSINEPFVALQCIDHVSLFLVLFSDRHPAQREHRDKDGVLRLRTPMPSFSDVLERAFNPIVHFSGNNADVMLGLLAALERVIEHNRGRGHQQTLLAYAGVLAAIIRERQWGPEQRRLIEARCEALLCRE